MVTQVRVSGGNKKGDLSVLVTMLRYPTFYGNEVVIFSIENTGETECDFLEPRR